MNGDRENGRAGVRIGGLSKNPGKGVEKRGHQKIIMTPVCAGGKCNIKGKA